MSERREAEKEKKKMRCVVATSSLEKATVGWNNRVYKSETVFQIVGMLLYKSYSRLEKQLS